MSERLTVTIDDGVARLLLDRPEKRNALDDAMVAALHAAIDDAERDPDVRVIAIAGAGSDFCAGADLAQLERIAEGADVLTNLDGLGGITSLEGYLSIRENDALLNVDGLAGITSVVEDLYVTDNPVLAECTVGLGELCRRLAEIPGLARLRYTTSHPLDMNDDLLAAHRDLPQLMPYLHLPVQSGSDRILKAMNRRHTRAAYLDAIARIRASRPDIALSGDFIVGFPGETDEDFEATLSIAAEVGYASAFTFKYSSRPGTPGAAMDGQVPEPVKAERLARLNRQIEAQTRAFAASCVGRVLPVLIEKRGRNPGQLGGRSPYLQAVHMDGPERLLGSIVDVEIVATGNNSLAGKIVTELEPKSATLVESSPRHLVAQGAT